MRRLSIRLPGSRLTLWARLGTAGMPDDLPDDGPTDIRRKPDSAEERS